MRTACHFKFTFRIVRYRTYSCPLDQQAGISTAQRFDGLGCGIQFANHAVEMISTMMTGIRFGRIQKQAIRPAYPWLSGETSS
jgi:hypothetical protein